MQNFATIIVHKQSRVIAIMRSHPIPIFLTYELRRKDWGEIDHRPMSAHDQEYFEMAS